MSALSQFKQWIYRKFDAWLSKVGEENRPIPHDYDHLPEDSRLFTDADRIGDEKGEFGGRY